MLNSRFLISPLEANASLVRGQSNFQIWPRASFLLFIMIYLGAGFAAREEHGEQSAVSFDYFHSYIYQQDATAHPPYLNSWTKDLLITKVAFQTLTIGVQAFLPCAT